MGINWMLFFAFFFPLSFSFLYLSLDSFSSTRIHFCHLFFFSFQHFFFFFLSLGDIMKEAKGSWWRVECTRRNGKSIGNPKPSYPLYPGIPIYIANHPSLWLSFNQSSLISSLLDIYITNRLIHIHTHIPSSSPPFSSTPLIVSCPWISFSFAPLCHLFHPQPDGVPLLASKFKG